MAQDCLFQETHLDPKNWLKCTEKSHKKEKQLNLVSMKQDQHLTPKM
jgi:hypothetical protein